MPGSGGAARSAPDREAREREHPAAGRGRLLLADPQVLVLEGLRSLLRGPFDVVGCVHDVSALERDARRLGPDLVVVGAEGRAPDGLLLLERVRSVAPAARVVVLADRPDPQLAVRAFRLGARAFVVRSSSVEELRAALWAVLRGERHLTPLVAGGDLAALAENAEADQGADVLTPREREVVRLTAEGRVMKEVGAALGISTRTVAFHKYRAMEKVGARSSADLVRFAVRTLTG